jgi:galactose mutarotase-like enzyme
MNRDRLEEITIFSADQSTSATFIPSRGGIGSSLIMPCDGHSQEMLYLRDNFWTGEENIGGWPFLFPVCGRHLLKGERGKYQWNGIIYDMPLHGFSNRNKWLVEEQGADFVSLSLSNNAETLKFYPFQFYVRLTYTVSNGSILCEQHYENRGREPMPFYAGFHPYINIDSLDREKWTIAGGLTHAGVYNDSYTGIKEWLPLTTEIDAPPNCTVQRVLKIKSNQTVALLKNGEPYLHLNVNSETDTAIFPYMQLYRSGNDPFICMEPWMDIPNGLNRPEEIPKIPVGGAMRAVLKMSTF